MAGTLMKCGCVAQGVLTSSKGQKFDPPIPACITHECYEAADKVPTLVGRMAQCSYKPRGHALKPSSFDLPFFKYLGEGSPESVNKCKCGYNRIAHYPRWRADVRVIRRWFKIERDDSITSREFHALDEAVAKITAEREADFFRTQTHNKDTEVFSAEVIRIAPVKSTMKCKQFDPTGAAEFDEYYCGCHGWN